MYTVDRDTLIKKLLARGWLSAPPQSYTDAALEAVIREYQAFHGLTPDGVAGSVTERSLDEPRFCSMPDRLELNASLPRWPHVEITWTITGSLPGISSSEQLEAYSEAWGYWANECGIVPRFVSNAKTVNVVMGSGRIDRSGGTLAWSELPYNVSATSQLGQKFDTSEAWAIGETVPRYQLDLVRVACHEIGHVLGLPHLSAGNLLAPTYSSQVRRPQAGDIAEVVRRYGPSKQQKPATGNGGDAPPPPSTRDRFTIEIVGDVAITKNGKHVRLTAIG